MSRIRTNSGANLNHQWNVEARHALYREDGKFYMPLKAFPGAYFDTNGYVLFKTQEEYENCSYLKIGIRVNVSGGISKMPGYIKVR